MGINVTLIVTEQIVPNGGAFKRKVGGRVRLPGFCTLIAEKTAAFVLDGFNNQYTRAAMVGSSNGGPS
jgi:hypothetical protein